MRYKTSTRIMALVMALILLGSDALPAHAQETDNTVRTVTEESGTEASEKTEDTIISTEQENIGFTITDGVLTNYTGEEQEIQIPSDVTEITADAFQKENCPNLKEIHIASTEVIVISEKATDFSVLIYVEDDLASSYIPTAEQLWRIVPESAQEDESGCVMSEDKTVLYAYMPSGNIGDDADDLAIPETVKSIGASAFQGIEMKNLKLPNTLTSVATTAFYGAVIDELDVTEWLVSDFCELMVECQVGDVTVNRFRIADEEYHYANIYDMYDAIYPCYGQRVVCPESAKIENDFIIWEKNEKTRLIAYTGTEETVTIPEGVEEVFADAFYVAEDAVTIIFPESLEALFEYSCYAKNVTTYVFKASTVPKIMYTETSGEEYEDASRYDDALYSTELEKIYVPLDAYGEYVNAFTGYESLMLVEGYEPTADENGFVIVDGVLLRYEGNGGRVTIPDDVTVIGEEVFYGNTSVTEIEFPDGLKKIGEIAFRGCSNLTGSLIFPDTLEYIGYRAFQECGTNLDVLRIPDHTVVDNSFKDTGANTVIVGEGIEYLGWLGNMACEEIDLVILREEKELTAEYLESIYISSVPFDVAVTESMVETYEAIRAENSEISSAWPVAYAYYNNGCVVDLSWSELIYYYGEGGKVAIPEGVEYVGWDVFSGRNDITEIVFPSTLKEISEGALENMTGVKTLTFTGEFIPSYVGDAIRRMAELPENVYLDGLTADGYNHALEQFLYYFGMTIQIEIKGLEADSNGFYCIDDGDKKALIQVESEAEKITVPEGVTHIAAGAFRKCSNLKSVVLPASLKEAGKVLFGWTNAQEIKFQSVWIPKLWCSENESSPAPESVLASDEENSAGNQVIEFLGTKEENAILAGPEWKKITVPEAVLEGYKYKFDGYTDVIVSDGSGEELLEFIVDSDGVLVQYAGAGGDIVVPDGVKYIPEGVFTGIDNITSVKLPEGLEAIGDFAFEDCLILGGTLTIPDSVVSIGENAFYNTAIERIIWGDSLEYIGYMAFADCRELRKIGEFPDALAIIEYGAFNYAEKLTGTIIFTDNITYVGSRAFGNTAIEGVKFGKGLTVLNAVFYGCDKLKGTVEIPEEINTIGNNAFYNCSSLEEVILPDTVTVLSQYTFYGCSNLKKIRLPESLKSIGDYTFYKCNALTEMKLPETLTTIGYWAFAECNGLSKVVIPDAVTSIGNSAFYNCTSLKEVYLGDGLTTLGNYALKNCSALELVSFGKNFHQFSVNCMVGAKNLKTFIFRGTTVPKFYSNSSSTTNTTDSYYSCFPDLSYGTNVSVYVPSSAMASYQSGFSKATRVSKYYYDYLSLAAENVSVMEAVSEGADGIYLTFDNPYRIPVTKWEVLKSDSPVVTVSDGSTGTFVSGGAITDSYMLKVYDGNNNSYIFTTPAAVVEGNYGVVETKYEDKIVTEDTDLLCIDVWFDSEKTAANAGTLTFYYKDADGNDVVLVEGVMPAETLDGRKRTYETEWDLSVIVDGVYDVFAKIDGDTESSEVTEITVAKGNAIPKVAVFDVAVKEDGDVGVSWQAPENLDTLTPAAAGYRIYRTEEDGEEILAVETGIVTEWVDKTVVSGQTVSYRISMIDSHGREGELSKAKSVRIEKDAIAPEIRAQVEDQTHFKDYLSVEYEAYDNRNISKIQIFVKYPGSSNFVLYAENHWDYAYFDYSVEKETSQMIQIKVVALDTSGNKTTQNYTYYQDYTNPDAVTEIQAEAKHTKELTVSWKKSASDDVVKYYVTCASETQEVSAQEDTKVTFTKLAYDKDYEIRIIAEDSVGNQSEAAAAVGHTLENVKPVVSLEGPEDGSICNGTVTYSVTSSDDYQLQRVYLEYSVDQENWNQLINWSEIEDSLQETYTLNLNDYRESKKLYIRACAIDSESAASDYDTKYIELDYTGPTVSAETITSEYVSPYLHVSFKQSKDKDTSYYVLYYVNGNSKTKLREFLHNVENEEQIFTYAHVNAKFGQNNTYAIYAYDTFGNESVVTKDLYAYKYEEPVIGKMTAVDSPDEFSVGGIYNTIKTVVTYPDHITERASEISKAVFSYIGFDGKEYSVEAERTETSAGISLQAVLDLETLRESTDVTLILTDNAGNTYRKIQTFTLVTEQPEAVYGLYVYSTETKVHLNWTIAPEITTTGYKIYRKSGDSAFVLYKEITDREQQSFDDTDVVEDVLYTYYMTAVSEMGVESDPCLTFEVKLQTDEISPELKILPATGKTFGSGINITAKGSDNVSVKTIRLYRMVGEEKMLLIETQGSSLSYYYEPDDSVTEGAIVFCGEAEDGKGNLSATIERTYYLDRTGPGQVTGLNYTSTATTAVINWEDVSANDFSYFSLERFDSETEEYKEVQKIYNYRGVSITGLSPDTTYIYRVVAYDLYGNRGVESEPISVVTAADTTAPVITQIEPSAKYYNSDFTVKYTAQDDVGISKMTVQYSADGVEWTDVKTYEYTDGSKKKTCTYTFRAEQYEDGKFQTRAIAEDAAGNISNQTATAPFTEYGFDRVAPAVPTNVKATVTNGYINVTWNDNTEADKNGYNVYRSLNENSDYKLVSSGRKYVNYPDTSVVPETTYFYKISAVDKYGNESACSTPVSIKMQKDEEIPVVYSINPTNGALLTDNDKTFRIKAADNYQVEKLIVEYAVNGEEYVELETRAAINKAETIAAFDMPTGIEHGDRLSIRAKAYDIYGNESELKEASYIFDKESPEIRDLTCEVSPKNQLDVTLSWNCDTEDLNGFRIYRKMGSGTYQNIGSQAKNEEGVYRWTDATITESMKYYTYKVVAVDMAGNTFAETTDAILITKEVPVYPSASLKCTTTMQEDTEYIFDITDSSSGIKDEEELTYQIDFGDGSEVEASPYVIHKYENTGTYTVTVIVTNSKGYSDSVTRTVTVFEKSILGTVKVKVVNESGKVLSGIPVYFDMDHTTNNIQSTNTSGIATFTAKAGTYKVGAYAEGYLPDQSQMIITAGSARTVTLVLEEEELVTGTFEVKRMTLSEIKAAGIDPADPANQNVVKADISFSYGAVTVNMECFSTEEETWGDSAVIQTESGERKLIAQPVKKKKTSSSSGSSESKEEPEPQEIETIVILDVPVNASCLKEFFDVKLHIVNNATSEFHLIHNEVNLQIPEGMSLVSTSQSEKSTNVTFGTLAGQQQHTINWILRGDEEGSYDLIADYSAVLQEFDVDVSATFKTEEPIKVYGLSNLQLVIQANEKLRYNTAYFILGLRNAGTTDILYPTIDIPDQLVQATIETTNLTEAGGDGGGGGSMGGRSIEERSDTEDTETTVETKKATLLEQRVSNGSGFSQVVSGPPEILAAAEMYSKKFAVYGLMSNTDLGKFREMMVELSEGFGVQVVVETVDMDLYDTENAEQKVESMLNGANSSAYEFLTTNSNFAYYTTYTHSQTDCSDEIKDFADIVFGADFSSLTGYEEEEIIKKMLAEMMVDSSIQQNVQEKIDTAYIDTVKKALKNLKNSTTVLEENADNEIDEFLEDTKAITELAEALKLKGASGEFVEATIAIAGSAGYQVLENSLKSELEESWLSVTGTEINNQLKGLNDVINAMSDAAEIWNQSADSVNLLMNMQYSYEESVRILEALEKADDDVVRRVASEMLLKIKNHKASMIQEFTTLWAKGLVNDTASGIQDALTKVFESNMAGKVYGWATVIYSIEDNIFGWSETYDAQEKAIIAGRMTDAFLSVMNAATDPTEKLHAFRHVIKMRFIGERVFTELLKVAYEKQGMDEEEVEKKVIAWYDNQVMRITKYRDAIFQSEATDISIPAAPIVTIDYENLCTMESFSDEYEYSFDNDEWIPCKNEPISFEPKTYSSTLYVRVRGNSEHLTGSIRVVALPAIRKLDKEARVLCFEGKYTIKGLTAGEHYQYMLTNSNLEESPDRIEWSGWTTAKEDGTIVVVSDKEYDYLMLRLPARGTKIASDAKALPVKIVERVVAPTVNYNSGKVYVGKKIQISCENDNAIIYYTTDGSDPIPGSKNTKVWTPYTELVMKKSFTLKVMASIPEDECYHDSNVVTRKYTAEKYSQKVTVNKTSYTYVYQSKSFSLGAKAKTKLTYKTSNSKVATVSSTGKVTLKGYGTAKITITAASTDTYKSAVQTVTVMVKPVKGSITSITAGTKKLTVKWKKDTRATGYQLQYSTSSKFNASTTKAVKLSKSTTSKKLTGLKSSKKYYVRIRAYTTVGGKTLYGSWSAVKSKKTK